MTSCWKSVVEEAISINLRVVAFSTLCALILTTDAATARRPTQHEENFAIQHMARCSSSAVVGNHLPADVQSISSAGVRVTAASKIQMVVEVRTPCGDRVSGVFPGGVIVNDKYEYSITRTGLSKLGEINDYRKRSQIDHCPNIAFTRVTVIKCIDVPGVKNTFVVLGRSGSDYYVATLAEGRLTPLLTTTETPLLDASYLPAPDAPGGAAATFLKLSQRRGYFVIVRSPF